MKSNSAIMHVIVLAYAEPLHSNWIQKFYCTTKAMQMLIINGMQKCLTPFTSFVRASEMNAKQKHSQRERERGEGERRSTIQFSEIFCDNFDFKLQAVDNRWLIFLFLRVFLRVIFCSSGLNLQIFYVRLMYEWRTKMVQTAK